MPNKMCRGELVRVMEHSLEGYAWTVGKVGSVVSMAHTQSFSVLAGGRIEVGGSLLSDSQPPVKQGWYIVSVDHDRAKRGYAYATLPETALSPHACTSRCGKHLCQLG